MALVVDWLTPSVTSTAVFPDTAPVTRRKPHRLGPALQPSPFDRITTGEGHALANVQYCAVRPSHREWPAVLAPICVKRRLRLVEYAAREVIAEPQRRSRAPEHGPFVSGDLPVFDDPVGQRQ
jgi:hypothetical protein